MLEPRSWSLRRNVFQGRLVESFDDADRIVIAGVFRPEAVPAAERLDPEAIATVLSERGRPACHLPGVPQIVEHLARETRDGDVVVVMSNGGFDGLHDRLLEEVVAADPEEPGLTLSNTLAQDEARVLLADADTYF